MTRLSYLSETRVRYVSDDKAEPLSETRFRCVSGDKAELPVRDKCQMCVR